MAKNDDAKIQYQARLEQAREYFLGYHVELPIEDLAHKFRFDPLSTEFVSLYLKWRAEYRAKKSQQGKKIIDRTIAATNKLNTDIALKNLRDNPASNSALEILSEKDRWFKMTENLLNKLFVGTSNCTVDVYRWSKVSAAHKDLITLLLALRESIEEERGESDGNQKYVAVFREQKNE